MKKSRGWSGWTFSVASLWLVCCLLSSLVLDSMAQEQPYRAPLLAGMEAFAGGGGAVTNTVRRLPQMQISNLQMGDRVEVASVLRLLARMAGLNILISPGVTGEMEMDFRDIAWNEAFEGVLATAGLSYRWQGDILQVVTVDDLSRELALRKVERDHETLRESMRLTEPMVVEVIPVRYLSAESVSRNIAQMLGVADQTAKGSAGVVGIGGGSGESRGSVSLDSESNTVIVHARRSDIEKALALVAQLDRPRSLVQIEARIVETSHDTARQLGMQWGVQGNRMRSGRIVNVGAEDLFTSQFPAQFMPAVGEQPAGFALQGEMFRPGGSELLRVQLSALEQAGELEIKASPTVTTLDNEIAVIESGEERAYRVSTGTGTVQEGTLEWKKAVLKLEVTPHVVDGNMLRVLIAAHKDSFDETKQQTNNEFPVSTKRARTTVLLANGETTMIGGFVVESKSQAESGIPLLRKIPLFGSLFRSRQRASRFDETIIFITPTIL